MHVTIADTGSPTGAIITRTTQELCKYLKGHYELLCLLDHCLPIEMKYTCAIALLRNSLL